jgi:isocitrate dehydrogenase
MTFADNLERACIETIESGKMTGDLARITSLPNPTTLDSEEFIRAIRETLTSYYA